MKKIINMNKPRIGLDNIMLQVHTNISPSILTSIKEYNNLKKLRIIQKRKKLERKITQTVYENQYLIIFHIGFLGKLLKK